MSNTSVVTSRIRLARNSKEFPFPARMNESQRSQLWQTICRILPEHYDTLAVNQNTLTEAAALAEQHWMSAEFAQPQGIHGLVYSKQDGVSVMVNEEDHLRIQAIQPGPLTEQTLAHCVSIEEKLGETIPYAFDDKLGYLTACPTNLGAAMRASVMLHLPALTESGQMKHIIAAVGKLGLLVRGFYGEGSEALGSYYQISNRGSLGSTESEIVERLNHTVNSILDKETHTRQAIYANNTQPWEDRVYRAYGLLTNAKLMGFEEALKHLSMLRMGLLEGLLPAISTQDIDALTAQIGPHTLAHTAGQALELQQRDAFRMEIIRDALTKNDTEMRHENER